jgi:hypothetical protein
MKREDGNRGIKMKILSIAAAVALGTVSVSALAKDVDQAGVADNAFAYTASASGSQSVLIGAAIEGSFSSQTAVAVGAARAITGGGGRAITGGGGRAITGGGGRAITGGGGHAITGGGGRAITGGGGRAITGGGGRAITGGGGR